MKKGITIVIRSGLCFAVVLLIVFVALVSCTAPNDTGTVESIEQELSFARLTAGAASDPRVIAGLVPLDVAIGANLFFRETFGGNGRTCATCHRVENNMTIDPPFIATLPPRDLLFVAEFNPVLANLERPAQMRAFSLILENVDGTEPGGPNVRFVLRTVPHTLGLNTSVSTPAGEPVPPVDRTGWSGDGAPDQGRLEDFANGAIFQHFTRSLLRRPGIDFRLANETQLQQMALFQREFGRKNEINLDAIPFSDAGAENGKQRFLVVGCNGCHRNAGANTGAANTNRNFNTGVETVRNAALAGFPADGGFGVTPENPDGSFGDGTFNSTPLIESADTPPFFHTATQVIGAPAHNTEEATTIEQATAFFATPAFANSPSGGGNALAINATDIDNIGRFLRATNAVLNIQMALKRLEGARTLGNRFGNNHLAVQQRMIVLALVEVDDAIEVLQGAQGGALHPAQVTRLQNARSNLNAASRNRNLGQRQNQLGLALNQLDLADTEIAANIHFDIGSGTLMD